MNTSKFIMCALPSIIWKSDSEDNNRIQISSFVRDALACERRILKKVNLENEFSRYSLICYRMEEEIRLKGRFKKVRNSAEFIQALRDRKIPIQQIENGYLTLLTLFENDQSDNWRGRSFFPPDEIRIYLELFRNWVKEENLHNNHLVQQRLRFFQYASTNKCGVIELQSSYYHEVNQDNDNHFIPVKPYTEINEEFIDIPDFELSGIELESFSSPIKQGIAKILRKQIKEGVRKNEPVVFGSRAKHDVITEVLNDHVFVPRGSEPNRYDLRIVYVDGSEAQSFPIFCLKQRTVRLSKGTRYRVALMSMRHLEMDELVDFYWFRNRDVSRSRTLAESDQFCFETTLNQLNGFLDLGNVDIHLYHTGFEAAVIGFYRAVTQKQLELLNQRNSPQLSVLPYYFRGDDGFQPGKRW